MLDKAGKNGIISSIKIAFAYVSSNTLHMTFTKCKVLVIVLSILVLCSVDALDNAQQRCLKS